MTVKSMITDFKNLFFSLIKRIYSMIQDFCTIDSKMFILLIKEIRKKIFDIKGTNIRLLFHHIHNHNFTDVVLRLFLLNLFSRRNSAINLGFLQYYLFKKNNKKSVIYAEYILKDVQRKNNIDHISIQNKALWYQTILSNNYVAKGCIDLVESHFTILSVDYVTTHIIKKKYIGHNLVLDVFMNNFADNAVKSNILDIGCGTGIIGHFLKMNGIASYVDGIELTYNMSLISSKCRVDEHKVYNNVYTGDYRDILKDKNHAVTQKKFDAIMAIDSINYEGQDIEESISQIYCRLYKGGLFIIAVPVLNDELSHNINHQSSVSEYYNYAISDLYSSCFAYSDIYLEKILRERKFDIIQKKVVELYKNESFYFFECVAL